MSVTVGFIAFKCERFQRNGEDTRELMEAVVGPRRIIEDLNDEGKQMNVVLSACTNFHTCKNPICGYSSYWAKDKGE